MWWRTSVLAVLALALVGCGKPGKFWPEEVPGPNPTDTAMTEVEVLTSTALERYHKGLPPTDEDAKALREAKAILAPVATEEQTDFRPLFLAGKVHKALGEDETALALFRKAVQFAPETMDPNLNWSIAEAHAEIADLTFRAGKFTEAEASAQQALLRFPENPNYLVLSAQAKLQLDKAEEAKEQLREALKLDPNHSMAGSLLRFADGE